MHLPDANKVNRFLISFYLIGSLGFILPFSASIFALLIKWVLLFNVLLLFAYHESSFSFKTILVFFAIAISGYVIEVIGVETGRIFGNYHYGNSLGIKIFNTPLLIGLNWLMLTYSIASFFVHYKLGVILRSLLGAFGMLVYDLVLEQSCSAMDMWYWKDDKVPVINYIAWFIIAFIFQILLHIAKVPVKNKIARTILICQFCFFVLLALYFNL